MAENPASTKRKTSDGAPNDGTPNDGTPDEKTSSDDKGSNKRVKIVEGQPLSIQDRFEAVKCQMDEVLHAAQHQASDATLKFEEKCEELEAIKMKLEAAQSEARELKRDKLSNMAINGPQGPEDGEVESAFSQLAYFVDAIGQEYFQGSECVRIAEEKQVVRAYFKSLLAKDTGCEGYGPYMKSAKPQAKEMFIQAVIWNKLIEKLLSTPSRSFLDMPDAINKKDALCRLSFPGQPRPVTNSTLKNVQAFTGRRLFMRCALRRLPFSSTPLGATILGVLMVDSERNSSKRLWRFFAITLTAWKRADKEPRR